MAIAVGTQLGPHEITGLLGKGGMGEVYRARDSKLKREVAIKILPEEFARDPDRVSRFQREAEVLASLNHPNIAAIYDLEEANGTRFLVLELVDGETLADRLSRGPVPLLEALGIAKHICDALESAHEKGVVHRDLKPANVKVTADGQVKVLDFGLAKALESAPASPVLSNSPTLSMAATNAGIILGTAAYMSPEQARGRPVDRRSDIFAFGCVLYEMLTGHPVFAGEDVTEILGRVVTGDPDWKRLPDQTPPAIQRLLQRALKKDSRQRLGDIRDARLDIEDALNTPAVAASPDVAAAGHPRLKWIVSVAVAGVLIIALAIPAVRHLRETLPAEMRLEINTPSTMAPAGFALSPDGRYIAFIASGDGAQRLWLRPLDKTEAQPMPGTDGADYPFWSPDSRSIGFFSASKLYRIDIAGGPPQALANAPLSRGGSWSTDGIILFTPGGASGLSRVAASGGEAVPATRVDIGRQTNHRGPQFLPDGQHFLFYAQGIPEAAGLYLGSLDGEPPKWLTASDSHGAFLAPDMVAFLQQGTLLARRLDLKRRELAGNPVTLASPVGFDGFNVGAFSVSHDRVAYRSGSSGHVQLTWFDRLGKAVGVAGEADSNGLQYPELSPDGRRIAMTRNVQGNLDIFLLDVLRGGDFTRFTFDAASDLDPVWSPDGRQIVFTSNRKGSFNLYVKPSSGVGSEEVFLETPKIKVPQDWSSDSRFLVYYDVDSKTGRDLWGLKIKERESFVVAKTPFEEIMAQFSPDSRFVAYQTNESGRFQIVVQTFPEATGKWQVSTGGGVEPRWRADGKELYFIAPDGKMMAVPVTTSGSAFEPGTPAALFQTRIFGGGSAAANRQQYAVSRDGRFLINQPLEESTASPITIILNWKLPAN